MNQTSVLCGVLFHIVIISIVAAGNPQFRERAFSQSYDDSSEDDVAVKSCGDHKECVPLHLCHSDGTIIKDGRAIIDMRSLSFSNNSNDGCQWSETCCAVDEKIPKAPEEYVSRGCGYSNAKGLKLTLENVVHGEAQFGEFPWMLSIDELIDNNGVPQFKSQGGGSLLAPNVVLTTAHKIVNSLPEKLRVRAGEWDKLSLAEPYVHQDRFVAKKLVHQKFSPVAGSYDAALLILKSPFKLSPHIDTICLPPEGMNFARHRCIVTGWGKKTIKAHSYPNLLKKIDLPYLERAKCLQMLRDTRLGRYYMLHPSIACAGGEKDRDACIGDGGAPLVCPSEQGDPNHYVIAGIVSWGIGCGIENVPGMYTDVQVLRPWIDHQLRLHQTQI